MCWEHAAPDIEHSDDDERAASDDDLERQDVMSEDQHETVTEATTAALTDERATNSAFTASEHEKYFITSHQTKQAQQH